MEFFETVGEKIAAGTEYGKQLGSRVAQQTVAAGRAVRDGAVSAGRAVRDGAVNAAGAARDKAVAVGRVARDQAEAATRAVASTARAGADWTQRKAAEAADWTTNKGRQAAQAASDGADWTKQRAGEAVDWTADKGQQALEAAEDGGGWVKQKAREAGGWLNQKGKQFENWLIGGMASGFANLATKFGGVERCIENMARDKNRVLNPKDGQFMGDDCPNSSPDPPTTGRLPAGCAGQGGKLPKIIYTNGINTPPEAACATMRRLANERCAEIVGVYNATYGIKEDVLDAKDSVDRLGRQPAAKSQARLIEQMLNEKPPQPVTLYAHSEGGLITQEGLIKAEADMQQSTVRELRKQGMSPAQAKEEAKKQTKQKMSNVDVYSFGTAEQNWPPVGANLHQFTNTENPVPKLIHSLQRSRGDEFEPENLAERETFSQSFWNPIAPHSMDDVYLAKLNEVHPVPKKANGQCC